MNSSDSIAVYSFEDAAGREIDSFTTQSYDEACEHAERYGYRVIENVFELADSELVRDYTPDLPIKANDFRPRLVDRT